MKNNLIFYNIQKILAGPSNTALITDKGELLIQGNNDEQQLGMGEEIGKALFFFPDYVKKDFFDT